jgi:hypothetical protein
MFRTTGLIAAALVAAVLAAGSLSAQQIKAPTTSKIPPGSCCAKVHNACISTCNKPGGCTGKGDCTVLKAR